MDIKKQQLLLEYLVSSPDTFALCSSIVKADYFDPEMRNAIRFLHEYYDEYHSLPEPAQIEAETGRIVTMRDVGNDKIEYCANEVESFCKRKAIEQAVLASPPLIEEGNYGKVEEMIRDAVTVSLNRNLGVNFFEDPEERIRALIKKEIYEPTGWKEFDDLLNGGLARKQMLLVSANSGGGKSIVMANLGLNYVMRGYKVLLISLELSEEMVDMRYIQMITGFGTGEWQRQVDETSRRIVTAGDKNQDGQLHIKRMRQGSTTNDIRAYLKEFELKYNIRPDMVIVDYVSLMKPNEFVSADNVHEKDKQTSEQLREIGEDYNAMVVTAAQQNRGAIEAVDLHQGHIAGGISKIDTTDIYVSIIMSDAMRAKGEIAFQFLKTRSSAGVGKTIYLDFNPVSLRITDPNALNTNLIGKGKPAKDDDVNSNDGLLGLMSSINS